MNNLLNLLASPRFISFYWRSGAMVVAGFSSLLLENIASLDLTPLAVTIVGLILGELSKALNNSQKGKALGFSK